MRWITNLCHTAIFEPWLDVDHHAIAVQTDLHSLLPETRQFLNFYIRNTAPAQVPLASDLSSPLTTPPITPTTTPPATPPKFRMPPLDTLEILLAALQTQTHYPVHRLKPVTSESGLRYRPRHGGLRRICTLTPSLAIYPPARHQPPSMDVLPIVTVNEVSPTTPLFPESTKTSSPRAVAAALADLFADERHADPSRNALLAERSVMRVVTQTVSQALLSQSGYAAVTNGSQSVLFHVIRSEDFLPAASDDRLPARHVVVRVSRAFETGWRIQPGAAHALVALVRLGIRAVSESGGDSACRARDCALRVGNAGDAATEFFYEDRVKGDYQRMLASLGREKENRKTDVLIQKLLKKHQGVVTIGTTAIVLKSVLKGRKVVMKLWNEADVDTLSDLLSEIRIFKSLRERFGYLLGEAVPDLVVCREEPASEAVLVTAWVGRAVFWDEMGQLRVGDNVDSQLVGVYDERQILEAALFSLQLLHDCGIAHGDIALKNLRVGRRADGNGKFVWHAWWVDLALAEIDLDSNQCYAFDMFRFERERVEKILVQDF